MIVCVSVCVEKQTETTNEASARLVVKGGGFITACKGEGGLKSAGRNKFIC